MMHSHFKTFSKNYVQPLLNNKKFVAFIMCAFLGTGTYTAYDLTGNKPHTPEVLPIAKPEIVEKIVQPLINCADTSIKIMKAHIKEHH